MIVILPCLKLISVSDLHLGQYSGKVFNSVSLLILTRVLFPQTGHRIHFLFISDYPIMIIIDHDSDKFGMMSACGDSVPISLL